MKAKAPESKGPFSRLISVDDLVALPQGKITISATPEECAALAAETGLVAIGRLEAAINVSTSAFDIHLKGEARALVTQNCVVSLEPFEVEVVEPIDIRFAPMAPAHARATLPGRKRAAAGDTKGKARNGLGKNDSAKREWDKNEWSKKDWNKTDWSQQKAPPPPADSIQVTMESDPPEPVEEGHVDLGAVAAEFMALGLDPWPRKPGVEFTAEEQMARESGGQRAVQPPGVADKPFAALARLKRDKSDEAE